MNLAATLFCVVTTLLSVQAITVSVDRADIRPVSLAQSDQSAFTNSWRPLTSNYDDIGINVSPSSIPDRSLAPLHPVLGKLQDHMAVSERLKPQRRNKPQQIEFNRPSILGSFTLFNPAPSNQRGENFGSTDPKTLSTEREYSFLVPPPRDTLRFELESLQKAPLRETEPYVRQSQFIPQAIKPDSRAPTYFIKPATFSTNPFSQGRPFIENYNVQQSLIPPRQPAKQFDVPKSSNDKPYYQTSNAEGGFNKNKVNNEQTFDRFQLQQAQQQIVNGNFYNQIHHPSYYKPSYERDPSFLVHESHEVSYVTPPSFNLRPATYHFDNTAPETFPSSTIAPRAEQSNKFTQQQTPSSTHIEGFKQFQPSPKAEKHRQEPHQKPANAFFLHDFQKIRYTPDINEVLPKANQPIKFNQVSTTPSPYLVDHSPKVVYVRPELQQQQYQSSIIPLNLNQRPPEVEYDTPESISLKHFNQQQFLLQQQLIHQDRERLREHEKRRQHELERQQQEELKKRQQEIKLLEQKQKEKQRLEQPQTVAPEIVKQVPVRPHFNQQFTVEEAQKKIPNEQYKYVHYQQQFELPQVSSEPPFQPHKEDNSYKQDTVQKFEEVVTPAGTQPTTQDEFQPVIRPYRPQKPARDQIRRRKPPTTVLYDPVPTQSPTLYSPESQEVLTDIPIQTTTAPEITTIPVTEKIEKIRTRRPGSPLRRRRPSTTTTTTQEPSVSSQNYEEEVIKYNTPAVQDFEKKKRVRPVSYNHHDSSVERRPISRKRPGQRVKVYNKEHADFDTVPERVRTTVQPFKDLPTENYPAPFLKELYSVEYIPTSEKALLVESPQEVSTESIPIEFYSETTVASNLEYYEPTHDNRQDQYTQKVEENESLDHIFTNTEVNYIEATTTRSPSPTFPSTTTTTTTTTTTEAPTTIKPIISSPKTTRVRPVRYGNATRPRFSIKEYRARVDYKNRLTQSASTEASTSGPKVRGHKNQQAAADPNFKEPPGRYKYMSRTSYRTTSTTSPTTHQVEETTNSNSSTTERTSRYTPRKRINTSHYYRSRVSGSTTPTSYKHDQDHPSDHITARPENVFSSSIRKRPTLKSRLPGLSDRNNKIGGLASESPETQSAAETGSFATTTLVPSSSVGLTEAANEIVENNENSQIKVPAESQDEKATIDLSDVTMDESDDKENINIEQVDEEKAPEVEAQHPVEQVTETKLDENQQQSTSVSSAPDSTTPFDIRHEEELFAKASQSVADLTSSASALYDKPGLFKAVSPSAENRVISAHLKISTDEPTLPIEAFFHDLSRKN